MEGLESAEVRRGDARAHDGREPKAGMEAVGPIRWSPAQRTVINCRNFWSRRPSRGPPIARPMPILPSPVTSIVGPPFLIPPHNDNTRLRSPSTLSDSEEQHALNLRKYHGVTARDAPIRHRYSLTFSFAEQSSFSCCLHEFSVCMMILLTRPHVSRGDHWLRHTGLRIVMRTIPESAFYRRPGGLRLAWPNLNAIGSQIGFRRRVWLKLTSELGTT